MRYLTEDDVLRLHALLARETGGGEGLRDRGLLAAAVNAPLASFGGVELYPGVREKAARLGFALMDNHAFLDGNKRIGLLAMLTVLSLNGIPLPPSEGLAELVLSVAAGQAGYPELLAFIEGGNDL